MTYPNGDEIIFDFCTKSTKGWAPSVDVISNANVIAKLGIKKETTHTENCACDEKGQIW